MSIALLAVVVLTVLAVGYTLYGRVVARVMGLDAANPTPANTVNDGVDFVPTRKFYLLGQHFSAIAAAGPIAGPILACQQFGWLPSILWIALGVVFIGAVHDFSSLIASVRHGAKSVAEIMREHVSRRAWKAMMTFIWVALIYVIVAFTDITASTFVGITQEFPLENVTFNAGGAVALASTLYLLLAVLMGFIQKRWNPPLWTLTVTFVPATFVLVWLSTKVSTLFVFAMTNPTKMWGLLILTYCFVASLVPVWSLLQPRGYLGGFVLYSALAVGVIGMFFGGFSVAQDSFKTWTATASDGSPLPLFPFLFVTIACGACSGFHGLVCSGTTSKQISREPDCRPVGYGAMLLEGFVALIALATIMIVAPAQTKGIAPGTIYGNGIGAFLTVLIGEENRLFAITFGAMAFSTFVFDTLDVATRLGRYILQELFGWMGKTGMVLGTAVTLLPAYVFIATAERGAYLKYWTLFGTSNQLLAALTLLAITRWLMRTGRNYWITLAPMLFVLTVTLWALILQFANFSRAVMNQGFVAAGSTTVNAIAAFLLLLMTAIILWEARRSLGGQGKLQLEGVRP
jgi:carbon starvation protein